MRIVHYLPRLLLAEGGVVRAVLDISAICAARGHTVMVLTHDAGDAPAPWRTGEPGTPRLHVLAPPDRPAGTYSRARMRDLDSTIGTSDVVHLHTPWDLANLQFAAACRRLRRPYVLTIHGMLDDWSMAQRSAKKRAFLALFARGLLERAAAVHCTAQGELDQSRKWYPKGRGVVIPLVFDLTEFRSLPGPEPARSRFLQREVRSPIVLFLSRLHPKKGLETLLGACKLLSDRGVDFRLLIAGTGEPEYEASLRALIAGMGLGDRASMLGLVTGVEKVSLYQLADVFALPTSQENFGFVAPEAMACGTPVITTKGVDIWPDLAASGGAIVVDPPTDRGFAEQIGALLADPARRAAMGSAGRSWVLRELDPERTVQRFEALYAAARDAAGA